MTSWTTYEFRRARGAFTATVGRDVSGHHTKLACLNAHSYRIVHSRQREFNKMHEKEPPKVPQKPQMRLKKERTVEEFDNSITSTNHHFTSHLPNRDFDNFSSAEPSDVEGHTGDSETVSSEEDISYLADGHKSEPTIINSLPEQNQENCSINNGISKENISSVEETDYQSYGTYLSSRQRHIRMGRLSFDKQKRDPSENITLCLSVVHVTLALHHCKLSCLCCGIIGSLLHEYPKLSSNLQELWLWSK
ncbi:PDZ domain-containing protein [Trichonephila clavipes]|nr:PDZ domain-containing protein [Trichonephila clavipes]